MFLAFCKKQKILNSTSAADANSVAAVITRTGNELARGAGGGVGGVGFLAL